MPVTIHIPLADVPSKLTEQDIVETGRIVAAELERRFGILRPRLGGRRPQPACRRGEARWGWRTRGSSRPAVEALIWDGIEARGRCRRTRCSTAAREKPMTRRSAMYHDQALIPAKTLAFDEAVNVTLGLPFIRTSPDHGTAFDIAGSGQAKPDSLIAALRLAAQMAERSVA